MEKKRVVELLIQEVDKIPYLKMLPHDNDEFRLWLKNVENIVNEGLEPEDRNKFREASQYLKVLSYEEDVKQQEYVDEIVRYEIALKSIIQKYEILGIIGEGGNGDEVKKMDKNEKQGLASELKDLYKKLKSYKRYLQSENLSESQKRYMESLREALVRKSSLLKETISESSGKLYYTQFGQTREIWADGLNPMGYLPSKLTGLGFCIDATNETIGKLEVTIEKGTRDPMGNLIKKSQKTGVPEMYPPYENYGGKISGDEFEIIVQGTVDMTIECVMHFTINLNSQGYSYKSSPKIGGHPDYATPEKTGFATCTIIETVRSVENQIGILKLQLIPNDRVLLKTSPPKEWDSSFKYFLEMLFMEFDRLGFLQVETFASVRESPKAFIAHGGRSGVLDKLREFVESLGLEPLVVELLPSKGMSVDDKVNNYIKDADCGIVLATKGGIIDTKGKKPKQHPRLNVIDELERLRAKFPDRTIILLEKGVDLPSNLSGLTHEPFSRQSMDRAFIAIARELKGMGILKVEKPPLKI